MQIRMRFKSYKTDSLPHIYPPCFQNKMSIILQNSHLVRVRVFKNLFPKKKKTCFILLHPTRRCLSLCCPWFWPSSFLWSSHGVVSCHSLDPKKEAVQRFVFLYCSEEETLRAEIKNSNTQVNSNHSKVKPELDSWTVTFKDTCMSYLSPYGQFQQFICFRLESQCSKCDVEEITLRLEKPEFQLHLQPWDPSMS